MVNFFLLILFLYATSVISKVFILHIENKKILKDKKFLLIPFVYIFTGQALGLKFKKGTLAISELSSVFFSLILGLGLIYQLSNVFLSSTERLILFIVYISVFFGLLYLSIWDILHLSIPDDFLKAFLLIIVIVNVFFGLYDFLVFRSFGDNVFPFVNLGSLGNILTGLALGILIFIIHRVSDKKAIGEGDIYIMMIIGFVLGFPLGLVSFLLTCILGSIVGVSYSLMIRKFKNVLVPFVPLILLGFVFAILIGTQIIQFLMLKY